MKEAATEFHPKTWGSELWLVNNEDYCGKIMTIRKGMMCSIHYHELKREHFFVLRGNILLEYTKERLPKELKRKEDILKFWEKKKQSKTMQQGEVVEIQPYHLHRFTGLAEKNQLIEISRTHFEEDSHRMRIKNIAWLLDEFSEKRIAVIGDIMLDHYLDGRVDRISPEAPIPVVRVVQERFIPGGAANVAANIATLGGKVFLVGVIGKDDMGEKLMKETRALGIGTQGIVVIPDYPTTHKMRIVSQGQQLVRVDREQTRSVDVRTEKMLLRFIAASIKTWDVVMLSDYAKGVFTKKIAKRIIALAKKYHKPVIADIKPGHENFFKGCDLIKPNHFEAFKMSGTSDTAKAGPMLQKMFASRVLITEGAKGMTLFEDSKKHEFAAHAAEVADIVGAGDTVAATVCLGVAVGLSYADAVSLANEAAGIVVGKRGTATVTRDELLAKL